MRGPDVAATPLVRADKQRTVTEARESVRSFNMSVRSLTKQFLKSWCVGDNTCKFRQIEGVLIYVSIKAPQSGQDPQAERQCADEKLNENVQLEHKPRARGSELSSLAYNTTSTQPHTLVIALSYNAASIHTHTQKTIEARNSTHTYLA
jgi:hypothetical protein